MPPKVNASGGISIAGYLILFDYPKKAVATVGISQSSW